jgi:CheY-like chemotaxis protein
MLRILVVDDMADSAESMAELLELWGHAVRMAASGPEALELVREFNPQLVLLDLGMPGMDGFETARRLRAEHGRAPVLVALTGYGQIQDQEASRAAGFDYHMIKPVDLPMLRELLAGLLPQG